MIENILVQLLTDRCQIAAVVRRCNQCDALGSLFSLNIELPASDVRVLVAPMFEWPAHSTGLQSAAWTSHWFYIRVGLSCVSLDSGLLRQR